MMRCWSERVGLPVEIRDDDRFLCSHAEFQTWAAARKNLRMEFFYREMRRDHNVLMQNGKPAGGKWNYDAENRRGFGKRGPGLLPPPPAFKARAA